MIATPLSATRGAEACSRASSSWREGGDLDPAADVADAAVQRMRDHGILLSTDGPDHNVIKMKPPLVFSEADADLLVSNLDDVLSETAYLS